MREGMPPPHWTPTGNSGEWRWTESDKKSSSGGWAWFDDDQSTLELPKYKKAIKRNWFKKLFNFFLTKK